MNTKKPPVIRGVLESDRAALEKICLGEGYPDPALEEVMLRIYLTYYLDSEKEHCFIAADSENAPEGYILCCTDFSRYEKALTAEFPAAAGGPGTAVAEGTLAGLAPFARKYPAHLHIDLAESSRGRGTGTSLIRKLISHLSSLGVPGLMLNVAADNEGAVRFYRRNGFSMLAEGERLHAMGIRLSGPGPFPAL